VLGSAFMGFESDFTPAGLWEASSVKRPSVTGRQHHYAATALPGFPFFDFVAVGNFSRACICCCGFNPTMESNFSDAASPPLAFPA
jgi:hypothetical protein